MKTLGNRAWGLVVVVVIGILARIGYHALGVRFSEAPLHFYVQFLDPELLRHDLLRSLFYLRDQPPLYNGFLGVVLKLFPERYGDAFAVLYIGGGLVLGVLLYLLLTRMRVHPAWAAIVTVLFVDGPITQLYENWLFYTFPLAVIVCAAALFLHRWLAAGRLGDAAACFALAALLVLSRNIFHPIWLVLLAGGLIAVEHGAGRRRALAAAALPVLAVVALLIKHFILFHSVFQGGAIQQINMAAMTSMRLPLKERRQLIFEGKLTRASEHGAGDGPNQYRNLIPEIPKTGIPVLDQEYKTGTEYANWNNPAYVAIGELHGRDARYVLRHQPSVYLSAVADNVERYWLPSDQTDPFNTRSYQNRLVLVRPLQLYNRLLAWQWKPYKPPVLHWIGMPLLLGFAAWRLAGAWRRRRALTVAERADALTVAFALYCILWVSSVTLLFSYGDHNRYRYPVSSFYCLFAALAGQWLVARARPWLRRRVKIPSTNI